MADVFDVLSTPRRILVIEALSENNSMEVSDLADYISESQEDVSYKAAYVSLIQGHIECLEDENIVVEDGTRMVTRGDKFTYYHWVIRTMKIINRFKQ